MRLALAAFSSLTILGGCAFSPPRDALSVDEVLADISSKESRLNGQVVAVKGWLGECGGLDCGLYNSLDDARTVARGNWKSDAWSAAMDRRLAVGGGDGFDLTAGFMQFEEVVIYGEVNSAWKAPPDESGTQFMCMDRCDDIRPHSIELIL